MTDLPADYTRCMGETPICPQRETCARFRDVPNTVLSWSRNLNIEGVEECLHHIPYSQPRLPLQKNQPTGGS